MAFIDRILPKRRVPDYVRDPMVDELDSEMGNSALPGRFSKTILRRVNNRVGVNRRRDLTRLQRKFGSDPFAYSEGLSDINESTGRVAADAVTDATLAEEENRSNVNDRRMRTFLNREEQDNIINRDRANADHEQNMLAYNTMLSLVSGGADLGASIYGGKQTKELIKLLMAGGE